MEKYDDIDAGNLGRGTFNHPGYEKDLMRGGQNTSFDKSHYSYYILQYGKIPYVNKISSIFEVERNNKGFLMTPYEEGGIHYKYE